jgi:hypothetical protein
MQHMKIKVLECDLTAHYCDDESPEKPETSILKFSYDIHLNDVHADVEEKDISGNELTLEEGIMDDMTAMLDEGFTGVLLVLIKQDSGERIILEFLLSGGTIDITRWSALHECTV